MLSDAWHQRRRQRWGGRGSSPPYRCNLHEAPLSPSYKFEKEEEGGEGLEEEEGEAAPPTVILGSATAHQFVITPLLGAGNQ